MKSFTAYAAVSSFLASMATAQYAIDPNSVANYTRQQWCTSQESQCPLICLQNAAVNSMETLTNDCSWEALTFACVCSNGLSPNVSEYSQTIPYFICTEWGTQCVSNCNGNTDCQSACREDHPCGAQNPTRVNTTSATTATSSKTAVAGATTDDSGATIYTGFAVASSTGSSGGDSYNDAEPGSAAASQGAASNIKIAALIAGQTFGVMGVMGVLFGGFAVLL